MPSTIKRSAPAASAIGCEPIRAIPPVPASRDVTSLMELPSPPGREGSRIYHNLGYGTQPKQGSAAQKSCGQPLGEGWPRAIRSGTGRGGGVTGSRGLLVGWLVS